MPYSREEILESTEPYNMIGTGDELAEHQKILDELSEDEKEALAIKMVADCPQNQLKNFGNAIKALKSILGIKGSFYSVITKAHQVKTRILASLDHRNMTPYDFLLDESIPALFNRFNNLALHVLKNKETAIAERLALTTPEEDLNSVAQIANDVFPDSTFAKKIGTAFTLRHNIQQLLGTNPELFFTDPDFNIEICFEFSGLFAIIQENEQEIGQKLSKNTSLDLDERNVVLRYLKLLNTTAHDQVNPFRLIINAMGVGNTPRATSLDTLFGTPPGSPTKKPPTPVRAHKEKEKVDDDLSDEKQAFI